MVENYQVGSIGFNKGWVAEQSVEGFMEHEKHHGLSREEMERIYKACGGVIKSIDTKSSVRKAEEE